MYSIYLLGASVSTRLLQKGATVVDDHDDNIFDEDDALDYIMYKEVEKEVNAPQAKTGCLGLLLVLTIPSFLLGIVVTHF
jgi:hypothetical protein